MTLLDGRSGGSSDMGEGGSVSYGGGSSSGSRPAMTAPGGRTDLDDDIPF